LFLSGFLTSFGIVAIAEMGDKTQLTAMCFVSRYRATKVLTGVFLATLVNNTLAVATGFFLSEFLAKYSSYIQIAAALAFIGFGLWTLNGEEGSDESANTKPTRYGPVLTVAFTFFIAEMGDKTQLSVIALAAKFPSPYSVLLGAIAGMLAANVIGIAFGFFIHKKIPSNVFKWISAMIFIIVGIAGYVEKMAAIAGLAATIVSSSAIILITGSLAYYLVKRRKHSKKTPVR